MQPPWTEIGRLESDVREIKDQVNRMVQSHEIQQITSNVASLERAMREVSSTLDGVRHELETLKEEMSIFGERI